MSSIISSVLRLEVDVSSNGIPTEVDYTFDLRGEFKGNFRRIADFFAGNDVQLQIGFTDRGTFITDVSNISSLRLQIKALPSGSGSRPDKDDAALIDKTVSTFDNTTDATAWNAGTKQHCEVNLTAADTEITPGYYWLAAYATLSTGEVVTCIAGEIEILEDGLGTATNVTPAVEAYLQTSKRLANLVRNNGVELSVLGTEITTYDTSAANFSNGGTLNIDLRAFHFGSSDDGYIAHYSASGTQWLLQFGGTVTSSRVQLRFTCNLGSGTYKQFLTDSYLVEKFSPCSIGISYDSTVTGTDPVIVVNGSEAAITEVAGSYSLPTSPSSIVINSDGSGDTSERSGLEVYTLAYAESDFTATDLEKYQQTGSLDWDNTSSPATWNQYVDFRQWPGVGFATKDQADRTFGSNWDFDTTALTVGGTHLSANPPPAVYAYSSSANLTLSERHHGLVITNDAIIFNKIILPSGLPVGFSTEVMLIDPTTADVTIDRTTNGVTVNDGTADLTVAPGTTPVSCYIRIFVEASDRFLVFATGATVS